MKAIYPFILGGAMLMSMASCDKELDQRPIDTIEETRAYQTVDDLQKGLLSVYSIYGSGKFNGIYIASILADEVKISNENRGQGQFTYKWQYTAGGGEHNADYATFY